MTEIFIDPSKSDIGIQVSSQSLHAVGFQITVYDSNGNNVLEQFTDSTRNNNPCTDVLQNPPSSYKGKYVRGTFTIVSPDGTDYPYTVLFAILEENVVVVPTVSVTGTTTNGSDTRIAQFHIN